MQRSLSLGLRALSISAIVSFAVLALTSQNTVPYQLNNTRDKPPVEILNFKISMDYCIPSVIVH